jgi:hypothetical protein
VEIGSWRVGIGSLRVDVGSLRVDVGSLRVGVGSRRVDIGSLRKEIESLRVDVGSLGVDVGSPRVGVGSRRVMSGLSDWMTVFRESAVGQKVRLFYFRENERGLERDEWAAGHCCIDNGRVFMIDWPYQRYGCSYNYLLLGNDKKDWVRSKLFWV